MYQWREEQRSERTTRVGGGTETVTTYTYGKDWSDRIIDSSRFSQPAGHENPTAMPYEPLRRTVSQASVGAFVLPAQLLESLPASEPVHPREETPTPHTAADARGPRVIPGGYYIGRDPNAPELGDVRIRFSQAPEQDVSVIAAQQGNTVTPYQTRAGRSLLMLRPGLHAAESMFEAAQRENRFITWILRVLGFAVMLIGLRMVVAPLGVMADVLPILGRLTRVGTGLFATLIAAACSLVTIALAWVFYRPLLGVALLALALAPVAIVIRKAKARRGEAAPV